MKKFATIGLAIVSLIIIAVLLWRRSGNADGPQLRSSHAGTTTMELSGIAGTLFTGYYVRDGQRVAVSNSLPWTFDSSGVSEFELRKVNPEDTFVLEARYDHGGTHAMTTQSIGPGILGVRVLVQDGLNAETTRLLSFTQRFWALLKGRHASGGIQMVNSGLARRAR